MRISFSTKLLKEALRISNSLFSFKGEIQFCSLSHMIRYIDITGFVQKTILYITPHYRKFVQYKTLFLCIVPTIHAAGFNTARAKSISCFWWMANTLACTAEFASSIMEIGVELTKLLHH